VKFLYFKNPPLRIGVFNKKYKYLNRLNNELIMQDNTRLIKTLNRVMIAVLVIGFLFILIVVQDTLTDKGLTNEPFELITITIMVVILIGSPTYSTIYFLKKPNVTKILAKSKGFIFGGLIGIGYNIFDFIIFTHNQRDYAFVDNFFFLLISLLFIILGFIGLASERFFKKRQQP